jgi:hypothetical protein
MLIRESSLKLITEKFFSFDMSYIFAAQCQLQKHTVTFIFTSILQGAGIAFVRVKQPNST